MLIIKNPLKLHSIYSILSYINLIVNLIIINFHHISLFNQYQLIFFILLLNHMKLYYIILINHLLICSINL